MFLYFYSEYYINEQKKQEDILDNSDSSNTKTEDYNKNMILLYQNLNDYNSRNQLDAFCLYLFGVICKEVGKADEAKKALKQALNSFPCLWSAWVELLSISQANDINKIFKDLDDHWMKYFYMASFFSEKDHEIEAIELSNVLLEKFPNSVFLIDIIAHSNYCLQGSR